MLAAHIDQLLALAAVVLMMLVTSVNYSTAKMTTAAAWMTETTQTENIAWD